LKISDLRKNHCISKTYKGKTHDFAILKTEFPCEQNWFAKFRTRLDLGFQGIADLYQFLELTIPHKKKRVLKGESNELSKEKIQYNKKLVKNELM
jgi:hypothetical protein